MITITIPTTGRPERLNACLKSIGLYDGKIQIKIGCKNIRNDIPLNFLKRSPSIRIYQCEGSPVKVQNALSMLALPESHILPISDDITFSPSAIKNALNALYKKFPDTDGIIGFKISNMTKEQASPYAFMLIGRRFFVKRLKRKLFYHKYEHFYADTELGQMADRLGKFVLCENAELKHFHPVTGIDPDETHRYRRNEKWKHDNELFLDRNKV